MKMSSSWKNLERRTAELLAGKRNYRGADFSVSDTDVTHPLYTIECKYRTNVSDFYYNHLYCMAQIDNELKLVFHKDRAILFLTQFAELNAGMQRPLCLFRVDEKKKYSKFLEDALDQAIGYDASKIPIVIYKKKGYHGELVYMIKGHFEAIYADRAKIKT